MAKVLVAYSSWAGSTRSIAENIAETAKDKNGMEADLMLTKEVKSLDDYQAILLGTSIHMGNTSRAFKGFLRRFRKELTDKPVAIFVVCANMQDDCSENREETTGWLNKTLQKFPDIKPLSIGLFSGALYIEGNEYKNLNPMAKKMIHSMEENMMKEQGKTDFRDMAKVAEWTQEVLKKI
jgi:menaquinone-dependent protoporphyrinogen oxidase